MQSGCDHIDQECGIYAHKNNDRRERKERQRFAPVRIRQPAPLDIERPIEDAFEHPEQVARRQDHRKDRGGRHGSPDFKAGRKGYILGNEARQSR